jgi:hypothetical protein
MYVYIRRRQVAAKVPEAGRMAFMLNVPTRDGGFKAEKVITKKMEGELNKEERGTHFTCFTCTKVQILTQKTLLAWERADALEAAKAAAARELHLAEEVSLSLSLFLSLSLCLAYLCMYVCMCVCVYIYIYVYI